MYLIKYNELGKAVSIILNPERGLNGTYINELPIHLDKMLEQGTIKLIEEVNNKKTYKIGGIK